MHVQDLFSLRNHVAVVTGGAVGLGYFSAQALAEAGAQVILTSRDQARADEAASALSQSTGAQVIGASVDLTREEDIAAFFQKVRLDYGRLDLLINNASGRGTTKAEAGYAYDHPEDQPLAHFEYTLRHNLINTFLCTKHALPVMKEARAGSIINMSSVSSLIGRDRSVYHASPELVPNTADYTAAKAGVIGLTLDFAAQVGSFGIRVNALLPGAFRRETHPEEFVRRFSSHTMLGRLGEFEVDLKGAVVFLGSAASRYMTGQTLVIDGGFLTYR